MEDIYEGKYSIQPKNEDEKIYKTAVNLKYKILPALPDWLEKKLNKNLKKKIKEVYKSILLEPRFDLRVNNLKNRDEIVNLLKKVIFHLKKVNFLLFV